MRMPVLVFLFACSATPAPQPPASQPPASQPAASQPTAQPVLAQPEPGCPADLVAAIGTACPTEGHACNTRAAQQATGLSNILVCAQGAWKNIEVPPPAPR